MNSRTKEDIFCKMITLIRIYEGYEIALLISSTLEKQEDIDFTDKALENIINSRLTHMKETVDTYKLDNRYVF